MTSIDKKALAREYRETPPPAGIYRIHSTALGRSLIGSSSNLPGILNRHRFELERGSHRSTQLQCDWNELGADAFQFEVLDTLKPPEGPNTDQAQDLAVLLEMWTEKLLTSAESLYPLVGRGSLPPRQ